MRIIMVGTSFVEWGKYVLPEAGDKEFWPEIIIILGQDFIFARRRGNEEGNEFDLKIRNI